MKRGNRGLLIAALFVTILLCFAAFTACVFLPDGDGDDSKTIEFRVGDIYKQSVVVYPGDSDPTFDFVVSGYDFVGWFEDEAFTKEFDYDAFMADDTVDSITIYGYLKLNHKHTLTYFAAADPTCSEEGNVEHWRCDICGKTFGDSTATIELENVSIPELGHSMTYDMGVDATCTTEGLQSCYHCDRCGLDFWDEAGEQPIPDRTLPKLGHFMSYSSSYVAPTCTTQGSKAYWYCSNCNNYFTDEEGEHLLEGEIWIDPLGHDTTFVPNRDATCVENGWYEHYHCDRCGYDFIDQDGSVYCDPTVYAYGHNWGNTTFVAYKDSTCIEQGNVAYYHCDECGGNFSVNDFTALDNVLLPLDPNNHIYESGWEYSETEHWKVPSCGHEDADDMRSTHYFGDDCSCSTCGYAIEGTPGLEYEKYYENDELIGYVVSGIGSAQNVSNIIIPQYYADKQVVGIGNDAFFGCSGLTSVTILNGATSIGDGAFYECSG